MAEWQVQLLTAGTALLAFGLWTVACILVGFRIAQKQHQGRIVSGNPMAEMVLPESDKKVVLDTGPGVHEEIGPEPARSNNL